MICLKGFSEGLILVEEGAENQGSFRAEEVAFEAKEIQLEMAHLNRPSHQKG